MKTSNKKYHYYGNCTNIANQGKTTYPILNAGGCEKLNPPPGGPDCGAMEVFAGGPGDGAPPAPKVNTPAEALFVAPNALAPPN